MDLFIESAMPFSETREASSIVGSRVLSTSGEVVGRVKQIRVDPDKRRIEGIVVKQMPIVGRTLYISHTYISRITQEAVLLKIEPASTYIGRPAVSSDGKKLGKVTGVNRVEQTNDITSFTVKRNPLKTVTIPASDFSKLGSSLILKKTYDKAKRAYTE